MSRKRYSRNHPSVRGWKAKMPMAPVAPVAPHGDEILSHLGDEELAFAVYCWEQQMKRGEI
jgi:hypothetical protein